MFFIKSKIEKMFYFRLLFINRKKCIFFNDLKTVFVQIKKVESNVIQFQWMKIYKNVCIIFDLIDNDNEWHIAFTKITLFEIVIMFRNFMITILIECFSIRSIIKNSQKRFFNNCKRIINRNYQRIFKFDSKIFEVFVHQNQQFIFFYSPIYWIKYRVKSTKLR